MFEGSFIERKGVLLCRSIIWDIDQAIMLENVSNEIEKISRLSVQQKILFVGKNLLSKN